MGRTAALGTERRKMLHIELMRLIACFFVIHIHTEYDGYYLFSKYPDNSPAFWVYLFISILSNAAVPLFFSISGALMLNRPEEPMIKLWTKRVIRYGILLLLACSLYYVQVNHFTPSELNIKEFIIILYSYSSGGITWFLYSYLAYLILLPILRTLAKSLNDFHFKYIFVIVLLYNGIIPILEYLVFQGTQTLNPSFAVGWVAENIVVYPLLGYYLEHRLKVEQRGKWLGRLWTANILGILISCAMTVYQGRIQGSYVEGISSTFFESFVLINCSTMYLTFKWLSPKIRFPEWSRRLICSVGQCTLGIYILHLFIMGFPFSGSVRHSILQTGMNPMLANILFCLYVMLICYVITALLKKLPGIKKLL